MSHQTAHSYYGSWQKRAFDVVLSCILLILLSPILLILSLIVLLTAGWPIFYRQKRFGQDKQNFYLLKLRTMYVGAEKNQWRYQDENLAPTPMYKNWNDPRFVGGGRFLAKSGLDELPQLWNILRGEMSFVGPRPLPMYEAKKLGSDWDFRYQVKPGIFSDWSLALNKRYQSLVQWKKLEKTTLNKGGLSYELKVIVQTLVKLLPWQHS